MAVGERRPPKIVVYGLGLLTPFREIEVNFFEQSPLQLHPGKRMTMENQPFEDVSPIKNGDFPLSC